MRLRLTFIAALLVTMGGCNKLRYADPDAAPIIRAAQRGQLQKVKDILELDASALNHVDSKRNSAAACAILNDHHEIAVYLITEGFPINATSEHELVLKKADDEPER